MQILLGVNGANSKKLRVAVLFLRMALVCVNANADRGIKSMNLQAPHKCNIMHSPINKAVDFAGSHARSCLLTRVSAKTPRNKTAFCVSSGSLSSSNNKQYYTA